MLCSKNNMPMTMSPPIGMSMRTNTVSIAKKTSRSSLLAIIEDGVSLHTSSAITNTSVPTFIANIAIKIVKIVKKHEFAMFCFKKTCQRL